MNKEEYEAKRQQRYERLLNAAAKLEAESTANLDQAHKMADIIPFGQPILVGHYSERRDRGYRSKIEGKYRRGYELHKKAEELRARAHAAATNTAIFSDDPQASEKLQDKIARLQQRQEIMKAANKLIRKGDKEGLANMGFSPTLIAKLFTPDFMGNIGFASWEISNNNANISRLKKRLEEIEAKKDDTNTEYTINGVKVIDNADANRLQLFFPGKPSPVIVAALKHGGFRWTPSLGCWQAYRGNAATYKAQQILKDYKG